MAIVGGQHGIFPKLKSFVESGKPVRACFVYVPTTLWLAPPSFTAVHPPSKITQPYRCGARARA